MAEEIKNQGQQENAENLNENVSGQAKRNYLRCIGRDSKQRNFSSS